MINETKPTSQVEQEKTFVKLSVVSLNALPDVFHRSGVFFAIFGGMHDFGTPIQTINLEDSQGLIIVLNDVLASRNISASVLAFLCLLFVFSASNCVVIIT